MIGLLPATTIFLATAPTDLRKAYDGLAVLVRQSLTHPDLNRVRGEWNRTRMSSTDDGFLLVSRSRPG